MRPLGAAALGAALALGVQPALLRGARRYPPLSSLPSTPYTLQDVALTSSGLRAAGADLAWIQLLQYSAGHLDELKEEQGDPFAHMKAMTERVVRLDPSFHRAYLYGAGILGWFRLGAHPDQAVDLLNEGLRNDPGQPLYSEYLAALAFQQKGDTGRLLAILEPLAADPRSPIVMKSILANLYRKQGEYERSLAIWEEMLDNENEESERPRARQQIAEIRGLMKGESSGKLKPK
ncbi:MAG: tetratricopeptide repeat protein [Elusimicrobiota bacterium]